MEAWHVSMCPLVFLLNTSPESTGAGASVTLEGVPECKPMPSSEIFRLNVLCTCIAPLVGISESIFYVQNMGHLFAKIKINN